MGILAPLLAIGGSLLGGAINRKNASQNAKRQHEYNMQMALMQNRMNVRHWNRQNRYNDPSQQMERFKNAGLNPHLIYGQGTAGNATAIQPFEAPKTDVTLPPILQPEGYLSSFQDAQLKQAQTDNVRAQTQMINERLTTETIKQYGMAARNADYTASAWIKDNAKQTLLRQHQLNLLETEERIASLKANRALTQSKTLYQKYENHLKSMGISSSDHPLFRIAIQEAAKQSKDGEISLGAIVRMLKSMSHLIK